ncbi:MAG: hypothetical protein A3C02_01665 [Candidatus Andersenbacteria bacterium RIFCSPHIGHO2_02_FULL_45_11]|uniref:Uncharacterized protein n=1 Tax=Candidatus Andersenbacteria bacterium RIFCSPHIGHO2_12_FULL_45_11 TaxID=1797281 RepID=A0A1G1X262_9BACT|nr:MAG: hypothetical protein A2805_02380 [Candidatus Andersenbacteria bacterium RIFCSPHIGHO2_01_FULL_46_36]OGY32764.1 MAG: hypothetical protein A3C02_01665 [Candidatus Andersenbacteria bacterium RIFCSPHIGHO2_02_FULL_45_11]OGY34063.1 MAG: hypothetical protein A3D99_02290 [Candidatus Andersenbacteria bacterium RIFCSPHIGHO2_12_FULL_45_11]
MARIRLLLVSSHFLNSHQTREFIWSQGVPVKTLDLIDGGGHLSMQRLLSAQNPMTYGIIPTQEQDALIIITQDEYTTHSSLRLNGSNFPIEELGTPIVVVPQKFARDAEKIAKLLAPYGDFRLPELTVT